MDNNYLYIIGFLGILLVSFIVFYFLKKRTNNEQMKNSEIQQHIQEDHEVECDGDKCFIKHRQTKYDKCDGEKCL
jgi:LPXTG-motif cell wall-anchored protein